jgi:hypothetical protein
VLRVQRLEQLGVAMRGLGAAEHQHAIRPQRKVQDVQNFSLNLRLEVNEHVPASCDIQVGKWRVRQQIVGCENNAFA